MVRDRDRDLHVIEEGWLMSPEYKRSVLLLCFGNKAAARTAAFDYRERVRLEALNGTPPAVEAKVKDK